MNYIAFEGINGGGKGVQLSKFENFLYDSSREVLISRIRTPNALDDNGKLAREMLKSDGDPYENGLNAVRYFGENHKTTAKHINSLNKMGHDVIGDRNYLSTFAFQHAQGISYEEIAKAIRGSRIPDLTYIVDVPAEVAITRLGGRKDGEGRRKFDKDVEFLEGVRKNYLELPGVLSCLMGDVNIHVIDGDRSIEDVFEDIKNIYIHFNKKM